MREQSKITQSRHERKFNEILKLPGNDRCADCNAKNARWCSYNLGIFLCIKCAALHRKIGCHISKVKSLSMDSWSNEQIENIRSAGGNQKVNSRINPHPEKHPLPSEEDDDSAMEQYIRRKWEKKAFQEIDNNNNNNNKMNHQVDGIQTMSSPVLMNSSFEISPLPLPQPSQFIQGSPVFSNLSSPSSFSVEEFAGQVQQQDMNIFQLSTTNPFYTSTSNTNTINSNATTSFNNNPFYSSPPPTTTNNPFIINDHAKSNNPFL